MIGYYRRFIPHLAEKAEPLTQLTKKNQAEIVTWTEKEQQAFEKLKKHLMCSVMLKNPDFSKTFKLQTDAPDQGIGAVLSQGEEKLLTIAENYYPEREIMQLLRRNV